MNKKRKNVMLMNNCENVDLLHTHTHTHTHTQVLFKQ